MTGRVPTAVAPGRSGDIHICFTQPSWAARSINVPRYEECRDDGVQLAKKLFARSDYVRGGPRLDDHGGLSAPGHSAWGQTNVLTQHNDAYSPAAGTVLSAGTQALLVTFTPSDAANYSSATRSVSIV